MPVKRVLILAVDDDPEALQALKEALEDECEVQTTKSGDEALSVINERLPDVVLLDITMPGMSGLEMLASVRRNAQTRQLPVIMVSSCSDPDTVGKALELGASDFLVKPVNAAIVRLRVGAQIKLSDLVNQLDLQNEILRKLASFDELTGVFNRRALFDALELEVNRSIRYGRELSVLMIDPDGFRTVNEKHGNAAGDDVLRQFVERVRGVLRTPDVVCRYSGETFCAILPETEMSSACNAGERVRQGVEREPFQLGGGELSLTVSIGISTLPSGTIAGPIQLVDEAEKALAEAKKNGRNRVWIFSHEGLNSLNQR